jgi:threonine dehydrogenase-like Zn-dependent dehydrogenase
LTTWCDKGWHGVKLSVRLTSCPHFENICIDACDKGFKPGESIVVFGGGPVGLMAAYSATLQGASQVYVVDRVKERLDKAKQIGCVPIDFSKSDAVDQILKLRGG